MKVILLAGCNVELIELIEFSGKYKSVQSENQVQYPFVNVSI